MSAEALLVIPTYDERENIQVLLGRILEESAGPDVLVVDDDSPDRTWEVVEALARRDGRVRLLRRIGRRGLGTAYVEGFQAALQGSYRLILGMDADLSHDPRDLPRLIEAAADFDLVLGSRYVGGIRVLNWPLRRLFLSTVANAYVRSVTRLPMRDVTSGFRCYRREVLEGVGLDRVRSNGYCFLIEMSYRAWRRGYRIGEVPIVFTERQVGQSKISHRIIWEAIWVVWKLRLSGLFGRL